MGRGEQHRASVHAQTQPLERNRAEVKAWGRRCMRYWLVCGGNDPRVKAKFVRDIMGEANDKVIVNRSMVRANMARQLRDYLSKADESLTLDQLLETRLQPSAPCLSSAHSLDCRPIDWASCCCRAGRIGALSFLEDVFRSEVQEPGDGRVDIISTQRIVGTVSRGSDDGDLSARLLIPDIPTIKRAVSASRGSNTNCERVDFDTYIRLVEAASRRATSRSRWKLAGDETALKEAARAGRGTLATQKLARWETFRHKRQCNTPTSSSVQAERQGFDSGPISVWVSRSGSSVAAEGRRAALREARHLANGMTAMALQAQRLQQGTGGSPADYTHGSREHHSQHTPTARACGEAQVHSNNGSQSRPSTVKHKQQAAQAAQRLRQAQLEKPSSRTPVVRTSRGADAVGVSSQHAAQPEPGPRPLDRPPVQSEDCSHEHLQGPLSRRAALLMDMRREGRIGEPARPDWAIAGRPRRLGRAFDEAVALSDSGESDISPELR